MKSFNHFLCEQTGRALINGKGLNALFTRGLGSYSKTKVKSGKFFFKKLLATPTEVKVEMTFSFMPGDEKGGYSENGFATVRRILDSELQDAGQVFNNTQNTPQSLAFHGKSPVEYHGKTELTQKTLDMTFAIKRTGIVSDLLGYLSDTPLGNAELYVATITKKLI